jgi:trimeric autotransporter adhesin
MDATQRLLGPLGLIARRRILTSLAAACALALTVAAGQASAQGAPTDPKDKSVKGSGTPGNVAIWTAPDTLGNSVLIEKDGNIGLGTTAPGSKLTVIGRIEADASGPGASLLGQSDTGSAVRGASASGLGVFGSSQTGAGVQGSSESAIGVFGFSPNGAGIQGESGSGAHWGVRGDNSAPGGIGIFGQAFNGTGVRGISSTGFGVWGSSTTFTGVEARSNAGFGLFAKSDTNVGAWGESTSFTGIQARSSSGFGLFAESATNIGIYGKAPGHDAIVGESGATGRSGVFGFNTTAQGFGVAGFNTVNTTYGFLGGDVGAHGFSATGVGVRGATTTGLAGLFFGPVQIVHGNAAHAMIADGLIYSTSGGFKFPDGTVQNTAASGAGAIVHDNTLTGVGTSSAPLGVAHPLVLTGSGGLLATITGVNLASDGPGIRGEGDVGVVGEGHIAGVAGVALDPTGTAIQGSNPGGRAGLFIGDVVVIGTLTKSGGSFKIDHPLDPANKYLSHSFVESPDMMNIYNGVVELDVSGQATIVLPDWFEALNGRFRYQLTAIGAPAPNLYIAREVAGNQFAIAGGGPFLKVSWQVTGIRRDPWAMKHRIKVEEEKPEAERGQFLHPELYRSGVEQALTSAPKRPL